MLSLTQALIYFFMMVGGGVRGMDFGIARSTIAEVGGTIEVSPIFIEIYPITGEVNTETIAGKVINGIINEYPIKILRETGGNGIKKGIGRLLTTGMTGLNLNQLVMTELTGTNRNGIISNVGRELNMKL